MKRVWIGGLITRDLARHLKEHSAANIDFPVSRAEDRIEEDVLKIGDVFVDVPERTYK